MRVTPLPIARDADRGLATSGPELRSNCDGTDVLNVAPEAECQIERLADLYRVFEERALWGDPIAANICLKVIDRYMRILGLDRSPARASAEISMTWADIAASADAEPTILPDAGTRRSNGR